MNNIVKVIATQHQHVYTLLNRIKDLEKQMSESLLEKENWWKFVKRYVDDNRLTYIIGNLIQASNICFNTGINHFS